MSDWHVNEGLAPLIAQIEDKYPGIDVGTIGDAAHRNEVSDHNPNKYGRVNAADFMLGDSFNGVDAYDLADFLIEDNRTHYVIYNKFIWTSETREWNRYTRSDPHVDHVHLSVHDSAHTDTRPWTISEDEPLTPEDKKWLSNEIRTQVLNALNTPAIVIPTEPDGTKWSLNSAIRNCYVEGKNGHIQTDKIVDILTPHE